MPGMTLDGDLYVRGSVSATNLVPSNNTVTDAKIPAGAAIAASKLQHDHALVFAQESATAAAAGSFVAFVAVAAGTVQAFKAGAVVPAVGDSVVTVDLKKNGTSVLAAAITLDNSHTARQQVNGTVSVVAFVAGDVFEVAITSTPGTGTAPKGVFAFGQMFELSQ